MATARKKAHTPRQVDGARAAKSGLMGFLISEDNGGDYHWTIIAASGEALARSPSFASCEDARDAAGRVRDGAGSARLEGHEAAVLPVDLTARRAAAARDDWDALDEGGSYTAAVAAELPAPR
jgi:uncharacterized protein YegP (UPF0339 family)